MADQIVVGDDFHTLPRKYKDQGDGTFAEVVYNAGVSSSGTSARTKAMAAQTAIGVAPTVSNAAATTIATGTTTSSVITGTADSVNGSSTLLNVTGGPYTVGEYIRQAGSVLQNGTKITAINGSTITMSLPATATGNGIAIAQRNTNAPWRFQGADMAVFRVFQQAVVPVSPSNNTNTPVPRVQDAKYPYRIEFDFDGQAFEMLTDQSSACTIRIWSNETLSADSTIASTGASGFTKIDFGSRAPRRVVVDTDAQLFFAGIRVALTDTISAPGIYASPKFAILGDSFANGGGSITPTGNSMQAYCAQLARILGYDNFRIYAVTGTGFVNANAGVGAYLTRVPDVTAYAPDLVLVQGSINDGGLGGIQVAVTTVLTTLTAALPAAKIVVVGSMPTHTPNANDLANNVAISAACSALGISYIDPTTFPWIFGSGSVAVPTADGNADFYQSGVTANHPSLAGAGYLARRIAAAIAPILGSTL